MDNDIRNRYRRDYTNEVIRASRPAAAAQPAHHHLQQPPDRAKTSHRAKPRRRLLVMLVILLLIAGAAGAGYWYRAGKLASPIPVATRASVNFPLLYPTRLPPGYHLDKNSFSSSGGVVIYSAVNQSAGKIAFTVQQRPATFDFNNFYKQSLTNSTTFDTPVGQAAIGTSSGRPLGSLVTDQSWLLVSSASPNVQGSDIRLVLQNAKIASR